MSVRAEFERLLKESDHFADVINTNRAATAEIVASFFSVMVTESGMPVERALEILSQIEKRSGPLSLKAERRHLISSIRSSLQPN